MRSEVLFSMVIIILCVPVFIIILRKYVRKVDVSLRKTHVKLIVKFTYKNIELYERMSRRNSDFVEMLGIDKVEEIEKESRRQLKEEFFKNIKELEKYQEEIKSGSGDMDEFLRIEKAKVELREIYDRCVLIHPLLMPNLIPLEDFDDLDELYKKYCKRK